MKLIENENINDFFEVPFKVYKDSQYISPFKDDIKRFLSKKNPLIRHFGELTFFVAYNDEGQPVGRITAHIHHKSNELHQMKRGFFGYFDCEDNIETARLLLGAAEKWLKARGMTEIAGNFNLTAMQQIGVMVDGFEKQPYTDQLYTPPHIHKLLEELGFSPFFPVTTFELDLKALDLSVFIDPKLEALKKNPDYEFRTLEKSKLKEQVEFACSLLNDGFKNNPMFVPLTNEEFWFQAKDMSLIIDEKITSFVYYKKEPAGVVIVIPDFNPLMKEFRSRLSWKLPFKLFTYRKKAKRCILIFASVRGDQHSNGLGLVMVNEALRNMKERGYETMGVTWVSDENKAPLAMVKRTGAKPYHRLYLYKKDL